MPEGDYIKFLGTAGARFVVARQLRYSAGTHLHLAGRDLILDPGPGTITRCALARPKVDVTELDGVILTHAHIDHSTDVNAVIDAFTAGGFDRGGALFAPGDCLEGQDAVVLPYAKDLVERVEAFEPETSYSLGDLHFRTTCRLEHSVETYGLKFDLDAGVLAFVVDTEYFPELAEQVDDVDVLVVNTVRHHKHKERRIQHLTVDEVGEIISQVRPRRTVLTHFGMTMIKAKPWEVAQRMSDELGLRVEAASDGMTLELGDDT